MSNRHTLNIGEHLSNLDSVAERNNLLDYIEYMKKGMMSVVELYPHVSLELYIHNGVTYVYVSGSLMMDVVNDFYREIRPDLYPQIECYFLHTNSPILKNRLAKLTGVKHSKLRNLGNNLRNFIKLLFS